MWDPGPALQLPPLRSATNCNVGPRFRVAGSSGFIVHKEPLARKTYFSIGPASLGFSLQVRFCETLGLRLGKVPQF